MNPQELIDNLRSRGVSLRVAGDELRLTAPAGTITDQDKTILASMKPAIIEHLTRPSAGTLANPINVNANRRPADCLFDCQGRLTPRGNLWNCDTCGCWFTWAGPLTEDDHLAIEIDEGLRALEAIEKGGAWIN